MYDLKELQDKEIEILKAVTDVCNNHNLEYIIMFGTLLGAVRHKGFIPWDDDIDICMPRDSYEKFLEIAPKYLPVNFKIQHYVYEDECPNIYAKVRDEDTIFLHAEHINLDINQGVFIDIFPMDKIKTGRCFSQIEFARKKIFDNINMCHDLEYVKTIKRKNSLIIGYLIYYVIWRGFFRFRKRKDFIAKEDTRRKRLHDRGADWTFYHVYKNVTGKYSRLKERKLYEFNGNQYWGPRYYDEVLTKLYGDYMAIPPKEERITHKPLEVNLNQGLPKSRKKDCEKN